jgi:hypothetical protein
VSIAVLRWEMAGKWLLCGEYDWIADGVAV